jgi:excinuclease ABC subunit A
MLYSRAGTYPPGQPMLYAEDFSPNTAQGACPRCHGIGTLRELGLGYLSLDRSTPTLSPGELQRLRLATQIRSNLFGVVYVLDEPSAGLHPADGEALLKALGQLKQSGNSVFVVMQLNTLVDAGNTVVVVEHDMRVVAASDWVIDMGPGAGDQGGRIVARGTPDEIAQNSTSRTARYLGVISP